MVVPHLLSRSLAWACALLLCACGDDAAAPATGGASGAGTGGMSGSDGGGVSGVAAGAGGGGGGGGASGSAGVAGGSDAGGMSGDIDAGEPPTMSRTEACIAYEVARRARYDACYLEPVKSDEAYARAVTDCPDIFFSEGSTRTIESLLACAEVFRTIECSELYLQRIPACVSDGTIAAGEPCTFGPQCASLVCFDSFDGCGKCAQRREPGEACDLMTEICAPGYGCVDGVCEANEPYEPAAPPEETNLPTGAACTSTRECTGYDLCLPNDASMTVCTARVPLDGSCDQPSEYCDRETYCSPESLCVALPGADEPCGLNFGEPRWCAPGLACDASDPVGATCKPILGGDCLAAGFECEEGTVCCTAPDCATPMCLSVLLPGEACGDAGSRCIAGTECMSGSCEPIDSRDAFEMSCGL